MSTTCPAEMASGRIHRRSVVKTTISANTGSWLVTAFHVLGKTLTASLVRTGLCMLLFLASAASGSDTILVSSGDCDSGVHLIARGARLSDVLKRLSDALGFQLHLVGSTDSTVDVDISRQAPELVAKLSPFDNLVVTQALDPQCPGRYRIVKVWMLPKGSQVPLRTVVGQPVPRQLTEAEKKQIREGEAMYRKAHGMPPAGDEDDATK
jgi:hypothetical protein